MVKPKEEKSHDIEIVSIGKLYTGSWDKKYWSSSRGKDRYPYPVGYRSLRIQNGITYNMEILEGLKGPLFSISSTDGNSCSGDTPDIAWENFQKKSCCRVKLWRGKRFSCKVDGVEFYGFKNPFVQRLLRELVANIGGTEHNIITSDFSSRDSGTKKLETAEPNPDLLSCLVKTHVTGKRRRSGKVVNTKGLGETPIDPHLHAEFAEETRAINSRQKDKLDVGGGIPSIIAQNAAVMEENGECPSVAEAGMQLDPMDMSDHLKVLGILSVQKSENIRSSQQTSVDDVNDFPVNQEASDGPLPEEMNGAINSEQGRPLLDDNLCAPDALDPVGPTNSEQGRPLLDDNPCAPDSMDNVGDSLNAYSLDKQITRKDANVNNVSRPDNVVTDSHPDEEMGTSDSCTFFGNSDSDPAGQEITNSMLAILLPRAIPLLKTFSRKKKKSRKLISDSVHGDQKNNDLPNPNTDDGCICKLAARELAEQPDLERQKEMVHVSCFSHGSVVSTSGCTGSVAADSFEYDGFKDPLPNSFKAEVSDGLDTPSQLPLSMNRKGTTLLCLGRTKEKEINRQEPQNHLSEQPYKVSTSDTILLPEKEISAKSERELHCKSTEKIHNIPASAGKRSPTSNSMTCRSSNNLEFPKINGAGLTNELPNKAGLVDAGISVPNLQNSCTVHFQNLSVNSQIKDGSRLNIQQPSIKKSSEGSLLNLFARYVFPMPISMVQMIVVDDALYICVESGAVEHKESTVFVYMALKRGQSPGCPSLIGYTPVGLEYSKDDLVGDTAVGSMLLQFIPDAHLLVLANNVRAPYCMKGKLHCLCSACASGCFKKNGVKIVQLSNGYVSLVAGLETTHNVRCLLVCTPSFLLAAEEGGKLKLWAMNSSWSAKIEDWYLPTFDCMFPCLVELQRVPLSDNLVIGHNGFGEFGLWDIYKHTLISRFSSPGMSVSRCISCGLFRWQKRGEHKNEEFIVNEIIHATKMSFEGKSENPIYSPDDKDVAIWLLISTVSDPDLQFYRSSQQQSKPTECWRLALLVNDTVIIGSVLDKGAAAVTPAGHGIIGTCNGLVYMWELSTGKKLGNLHSFKGSSVSCITTDTSSSGAVAVSSGDQLLVYLPS